MCVCVCNTVVYQVKYKVKYQAYFFVLHNAVYINRYRLRTLFHFVFDLQGGQIPGTEVIFVLFRSGILPDKLRYQIYFQIALYFA